MTSLRTLKTNFTGGEITPHLLGRGDLAAYENGAARLRNVFIHPTGGVERRAGLRHVDAAQGPGRLVAFEFNTEQAYLLAFSGGRVDVYRDDVRIADIATPWSAEQCRQIAWTQSADTLLVCHPDIPPRKITRTLDEAQNEIWTIAEWSFLDQETKEENGTPIGNAVRQPYHRFAEETLTLTPSGTARDTTITLTASADLFVAGHVGTRFRIEGREVLITAVGSATSASAEVKETLKSASATKDWAEQAFSPVRGWPASVAFHQDRLVIGGARDLPNRLWLSKSSDLFNFDLGEGLDDEAIEFAILSDQVNAIRAVFSGRHLQVFTSGAEWMVTGDPLTPENIQLRRQTRVGSPIDRRVPPRDVDGATLFAARNGRELREFLFTDVEQAYQASDLALLAHHLIAAPQDQDYDQARRLFHVVMTDGTLGTVTIFRAEQVTAWSVQSTAGAFRSVAVLGSDVYVLVERGGSHFIERFDDALNTDAALTGEAAEPQDTWTGLDHLEGESVAILADGAVHAERTVEDGAITLDRAALSVEIGLPYLHEIAPLPPAVAAPAGSSQGLPVRLVEATFRLHETQALRVDWGSGFRDVPFRRFGEGDVLDASIPPFTGDKTVRALGWSRDGVTPLWRIAQDAPLPCTVLSVSTQIKLGS